MNIVKLADEINILDIFAVAIIVLIASIAQFTLHELPCPLCLLQRIGLLSISFGFVLNVRYGIRPSHYALSLLAAIFTAAVSIRQILLHIQPGSPMFGQPVLGLSLYTWVFIISVCFIIFISILMLFDKQFKRRPGHKSKFVTTVSSIVFVFLLVVVGINIVSTYYECGFNQCPENPVRYKMLQ